MTRGQRRRLMVVTAATGALMLIIAVGVVVYVVTKPSPVDECRAEVPDLTYHFDFEQAANASTIAAVGLQLGLPHHAVTVALAAALQESKLRNLPGGDRDSIGLFQQRPSQGWGTPLQINDPVYAATAFYQALAKVADWETLPVNDAAQRVQRSGAPQAYAKWETQARFMATVLTGDTPAGLVCHFSRPLAVSTRAAVTEALTRQFGPSVLQSPSDLGQGWSQASWLVAHARDNGITTVSFNGQQWTASSGKWKPLKTAQPVVVFAGPTP